MAKRRAVSAAPRRRIYHRASALARRHFYSRGGAQGILGSFMPLIAGIVGGAGSKLARSYSPQIGGIAVNAGVGYMMKNDTLMTLAGMEAGHNILAMTGIGGSTTTTSGGGGW